MRKEEISRKSYELGMLKRSVKNRKCKIEREKADLDRMYRKLRFQRIISAGRIVEDAELLDDFDPDALYQLLVENRHKLRRKDINHNDK